MIPTVMIHAEKVGIDQNAAFVRQNLLQSRVCRPCCFGPLVLCVCRQCGNREQQNKHIRQRAEVYFEHFVPPFAWCWSQRVWREQIRQTISQTYVLQLSSRDGALSSRCRLSTGK